MISTPRPTFTGADGAEPAARHRPFALVLCGGGARGAAHAGVLRALEHDGLRPAAIVGVSMGAIVGATYALNPNWYRDYVDVDLSHVPGLAHESVAERNSRLRAVLASGRALRHLLQRWGPLTHTRPAMEAVLERLTLGRRIEEGRIPVVAIATDLGSGRRVILDRGSAAAAAYASSALVGLLPPVGLDGTLLADGAYADLVPVDLARELGGEAIIVVNPNPGPPAPLPRNGLQAVARAMEISVAQRALDRLREADLELPVPFPFPIGGTDFSHHRICVAAGIRAVRRRRAAIRALLRPAAPAPGPTTARDRPRERPIELGRPSV